jgi:hypothetical protein
MSSLVLFAIVSLVSPAAAEPMAGAAPLAAGDTLEIQLTDQHDVVGGIDDKTKLVLFTRDMDASDAVKDALAEDGAPGLAAAGAVWVADISRMPRLITRMFALPAMRRRPYRMLLDRDGAATAVFPGEKGRVTLLYVDRRALVRIDYADTVAQVAEALRTAAAAAK